MSLLTICQAVAGDCGFAVPSTIVGNSDDTAAMLLRLINKAGKSLAKRAWQALQKEYTFSTVASTPSYALPSDYGWQQNDSAWDRSNYWQLRGSLSPQMWQAYKSGVQSTTPRSRFRIKGSLFFLDPTPSSIVSMVFEYISSKWAFDGVSTYYIEFQADSNTSLIDEYLLELDLTWRFLERKGLAYAEAKDEAEKHIDIAIAHDVPANSVNMADAITVWPPLPMVPVTGYS
jgi:hypothetical protein